MKLAIQHMRKIIKKKANFDIMDLDTVEVRYYLSFCYCNMISDGMHSISYSVLMLLCQLMPLNLLVYLAQVRCILNLSLCVCVCLCRWPSGALFLPCLGMQ